MCGVQNAARADLAALKDDAAPLAHVDHVIHRWAILLGSGLRILFSGRLLCLLCRLLCLPATHQHLVALGQLALELQQHRHCRVNFRLVTALLGLAHFEALRLNLAFELGELCAFHRRDRVDAARASADTAAAAAAADTVNPHDRWRGQTARRYAEGAADRWSREHREQRSKALHLGRRDGADSVQTVLRRVRARPRPRRWDFQEVGSGTCNRIPRRRPRGRCA